MRLVQHSLECCITFSFLLFLILVLISFLRQLPINFLGLLFSDIMNFDMVNKIRSLLFLYNLIEFSKSFYLLNQ